MMTKKGPKQTKNQGEKKKQNKQKRKSKQTTKQEKKKMKEQLSWGLTKHNSAHLWTVARFGSHWVEDVSLD